MARWAWATALLMAAQSSTVTAKPLSVGEALLGCEMALSGRIQANPTGDDALYCIGVAEGSPHHDGPQLRCGRSGFCCPAFTRRRVAAFHRCRHSGALELGSREPRSLGRWLAVWLCDDFTRGVSLLYHSVRPALAEGLASSSISHSGLPPPLPTSSSPPSRRPRVPPWRARWRGAARLPRRPSARRASMPRVPCPAARRPPPRASGIRASHERQALGRVPRCAWSARRSAARRAPFAWGSRHFPSLPLPPVSTAPTMACPPPSTVTRSTRTTC